MEFRPLARSFYPEYSAQMIVVVDETVIEGDAEPYILYENPKQAVGASE